MAAFLVLSLTLVGASAKSPLSRLAVVTDNAEASPLIEPHKDALMQVDAGHAESVKKREAPAAWFGGFHVGESTYTHDGLFDDRNENPQAYVVDGWNPTDDSSEAKTVMGQDFFVESRSGGPKQAWQSDYPALGKSVAGNDFATGSWFEGTGGDLQQEYVGAKTLSDTERHIPASWFDDSVNQLDGFGREKYPSPGSPRNFINWEEKSVNTTLTCKEAGCTANASITAPFNFNTEMAKNCRMSVYFHPTDFDDQYSGEAVEWVQVNNKQVSSNCRPMQWGCNKTAQRPLLPCVNDLAVDTVLPKNGVFSVAAKINKVVDECPYNGNLLSAVPMVTCLVAPKPKLKEAPKPVMATLQDTTCVTQMPLQCTTRGCAAEIQIPINSSCHMNGQTCKLSVDVQQTDFDNKEDTLEAIEYIKVNGDTIKSTVNLKPKPGENPCKSTWHGKPAPAKDLSFFPVKDHVVKVTATPGGTHDHIVVEGKITQYVDECASNGYLLDAMATVTCAVPGKKSKLLQTLQKVEVGTSLRRALRGSAR